MGNLLEKNMTTHLITVEMNESLGRAWSLMQEKRIRHLPVLDQSGQVIGILSDRDCQRGMKGDEHDFAGFDIVGVFDEEATVREYMSWPIKTLPFDAEVGWAARRMVEEKISAFVVTRGSAVVGIITTEDLLRLLADLLEDPRKTVKAAMDNFAYNSPISSVLSFLNVQEYDDGRSKIEPA